MPNNKRARAMNDMNFETYVDDSDLWSQCFASSGKTAGKPALFLDRDGAIVEEINYLQRPEDLALIPGATETIARANERGVTTVLITNQAGIGRGYFGWHQFAEVQEKLVTELSAANAHLDAVFACPHHSDGKPPHQHPNHPARKPNPGMLLMAEDLLGIDLSASWIVGDKASDISAGRNAGLAGGVHVLTGHGSNDGEQKAALAIANDKFHVISAGSIADIIMLEDVLGGLLV